MDPTPFDWTLFSLLFGAWIAGGAWFRARRALKWCAAKSAEGCDTVTLGVYWHRYRWEVSGDILAHLGLGLAWATGFGRDLFFGGLHLTFDQGATLVHQAVLAAFMAAATAPIATEVADSQLKAVSDRFRRSGTTPSAPPTETA